MIWFEEGLRLVHIIFGFAGLAAFWVPVFAGKGGKTHVRFGTWFLYSAYVVLASAGVSVIYHLARLALSGATPSDEPSAYAFLIFLGYLAFVTFVTVRHGVGVLRTRRNPEKLRTVTSTALARGAIAASLALIAYALILRPPVMLVLLALSPIGLGVGSGALKYMRGDRPSSRQWLYEHLGSMLGGGIAFHTAFAVFGSSRLFDLHFTGWVGVLPWILPAAIGIPATVIWTRYYRRKFGELRMKPGT